MSITITPLPPKPENPWGIPVTSVTLAHWLENAWGMPADKSNSIIQNAIKQKIIETISNESGGRKTLHLSENYTYIAALLVALDRCGVDARWKRSIADQLTWNRTIKYFPGGKSKPFEHVMIRELLDAAKEKRPLYLVGVACAANGKEDFMLYNLSNLKDLFEEPNVISQVIIPASELLEKLISTIG